MAEGDTKDSSPLRADSLLTRRDDARAEIEARQLEDLARMERLLIDGQLNLLDGPRLYQVSHKKERNMTRIVGANDWPTAVVRWKKFFGIRRTDDTTEIDPAHLPDMLKEMATKRQIHRDVASAYGVRFEDEEAAELDRSAPHWTRPTEPTDA